MPIWRIIKFSKDKLKFIEFPFEISFTIFELLKHFPPIIIYNPLCRRFEEPWKFKTSNNPLSFFWSFLLGYGIVWTLAGSYFSHKRANNEKLQKQLLFYSLNKQAIFMFNSQFNCFAND